MHTMPERIANVCRLLLVLAALCAGLVRSSGAPIRDGGIDPANLGKGDWIWYVSWATNKLGGNVPSVVNLPTLMNFYKSQGLQYVIVKAGTGSTNFNGGFSSPQFNSNLVYQAHAAGLWIFAYTRSYMDDVPGEVNLAANCFALGADGFVIDGEAEWESSAGPNGPALATQYGNSLRALFPTKFIAHAPFPIISYHASFPYKEFGVFCDTVMPQAYWKSIYGNTAPVSNMVTRMDSEWRSWQNSLTGVWTNAIKPLAPIGQGWSPATNQITTGAEVDEFLDRLRTNPNPASVTGYKSASFWRADLHTPDMWAAIGTNGIGDPPGPPAITAQPESKTVPLNTTVAFTASATGSSPLAYQWRRNGALIAGATNPSFTLPAAQPADAGSYSLRVTNSLGATTSVAALLTVTTPPAIFNVAAIAGGRSAMITWQSTNASGSQVSFGLTTNLGSLTAEDPTPQTNHSVLLAGLAANTIYFYSVLSRAGANTLRSDGWTFSTAGELILDNTDATFTGTWSSGTSSPDKYGADYRYATVSTNGSTGSAIFTPVITTRGNYDVFLWYPQGGNRTTNAPITVYYLGGNVTTRVNQELGGGGWRQVGTNLAFAPGTGGFVRVSNSTSDDGQVVMADAVRFLYRADQDTPSGPTVPDWWAFHYFGANTNALADSDGDGYANWMEFLAGTVPTDAASRLGFALAPASAGPLRANFAPRAGGRTYQLQEKLGFNWFTLPNLPVNAGTNGQGWITVTNNGEALRVLRLKVDWAP